MSDNKTVPPVSAFAVPEPPPMSGDTAAEHEFTIRDGVAWLGWTWAQYVEMATYAAGVHGGPHVTAMLAARDAQGTATTPAEVLAAAGFGDEDPLTTVKRFVKGRAKYADTPKEFE